MLLRQSPRGANKKGVLKNSAKFTGKHLCPRIFFNKTAGPATLSKRDPTHAFLYEFDEIVRAITMNLKEPVTKL